MLYLYKLSRQVAMCIIATFVITGALTIRPGEAAGQEKSSGKVDVVLKRHNELNDEELRKQLESVMESGLDQSAAATLYAPIKKGGEHVTSLPPDLGPKYFGQLTTQMKRSDQFALPWRVGSDCEMGKEAAEQLQVLSVKLRDALRKSVKKDDIRPDPDKLRDSLKDEEWSTPAALPTLTQMLQAEDTPIRLLLVELLGKIRGKEASIALAKRAIFDLSPDVRQKAVQSLADRPTSDIKTILYYGLRYPWAAAADHAAEAIVALQMTDLVSELVPLLKEPDPNYPVKTEKGYVVQEVVRINHLSNCMLCHAPSLSKDDLVRGRVPMPGENPPPLYYQERTGIFVRADLTYLRQDFSVVQPVLTASKWPGNQRYDYVLRTRPVTKTELTKFQKLEKDGKLPNTYQQQGSVLYALRTLTKADYGDSYDAWAAGLAKTPMPQPSKKPESSAKDQEATQGEVLNTILQVTIQFDKDKMKLTINAIGQVNTGGWKDAKLTRKLAKEAPADGIYEYELTAVRPNGIAPQVLASVRASDIWENPPADLKGIKVLGVGEGAKIAKIEK